jgi:hypothetical protein
MRSPRSVVGALVLAGCTRAFPTRLAEDDRGARVYAVGPGAPGATGPGLAAAHETLPSQGLTLVAAWGDDRDRFEDHVRRGPSLPGGRHVVFNGAFFLVVDDATGAPRAMVRWPERLPDAPVERVAVDAAGRRIAALDQRGRVMLGTLDGADLAVISPAARTPAAAVADAPRSEPEQRFDSVTVAPWRGAGVDEPWSSVQVAQRLFFSPDGSRLAGRESAWDVAARRPLLALTAGEALLAVDAGVTRAAVAALGVRTSVGSPGSQCGFVPVMRSVVVTALEARDLTGPSPARRLAVTSLRDVVPGFDEPAAEPQLNIAARPVAAVAIGPGGDVAVALGGEAWWIDDRGARALVWPRPTSQVRALALTPHGLAAQAYFDVGARMLPATALFGRDGRTRSALGGAQEFAPDAAARLVVRDGEGWALWDLRAMERVRALPDPRALNLSASDQARVTDAGGVVLREERGGAHVFLVAEGEGWRRVEVPAGGASLWRWTLAPDGRHVALHEPHRLRVVDLRDGRVRWERGFTGDATATAFAGDRIYVADDRGGVSGHSPDGAQVARVDLAGRFDHATALAVSPDGAALAVGTARGRVFVFRAGP